jgi:hypothetical protein
LRTCVKLFDHAASETTAKQKLMYNLPFLGRLS